MKYGSLILLNNKKWYVFIDRHLYDIEAKEEAISINFYDDNLCHKEDKKLNMNKIIYKGTTVFQRSNLTETEKNLLTLLKGLGMICLARDNDGTLAAYPTTKLRKTFNEWLITDDTTYPVEYVKLHNNLFKEVTSDQLCPMSIDEINMEVHYED